MKLTDYRNHADDVIFEIFKCLSKLRGDDGT
jgi:hypothetical protein